MSEKPTQFLHHYEEWPDRKENPHLKQALAYHKDLIINRQPFTLQSRLLTDNYPRASYQRRKGQIKSVLHWGQRKLLMSEIEFLTNYGEAGRIVLYAGAAPGHHINYLSTLFPEMKFVLVDPSPFAAVPTDRVTIIQDFFTDDLAEKYSGLGVLFISDIRTASWQEMKEEDVESYVESDNVAQMRWHGILKPHRSMLKFRLPYVENHSSANTHTRYLDGEVYLPVWGPQTTSETRLVPCATPENVARKAEEDGKKRLEWEEKVTQQQGCNKVQTRATNEVKTEEINPEERQKNEDKMDASEDPTAWCKMKVWDNKLYEDQMFYFNTIGRVTYYEHQVEGDGLDHCYDCCAEIYILQNYLVKSGKLTEDKIGTSEANKMISEMSLKISPQCSSQGRTLSTPQPKPYGATRGRRDRPNLPAIYDTDKIKVDRSLMRIESEESASECDERVRKRK